MLQYILTSLMALFGTTTPGTPKPTGDYGIGISLSKGYGTVSAYFSNGSLIDIAKVEGGPGYKSYMTAFNEVASPSEPSPIYCPLPQNLCEYWPIKRSPPNPLAPMLNALIAATKATLETSITTVAINIYDLGPIDRTAEHRFVQTVLYPQGISDWQYPPLPVGRPLIGKTGLVGDCSIYVTPDEPGYFHDPPQVILVVDYSRLALTASLFEESCGVAMLTDHHLHSRDLGFDGMQTCMNNNSSATETEETCKDSLVAALRTMLKGSGYAKIGGVLIIGENGDNQVMLDAVRLALTKEFENGATVDLELVKQYSPDAAFAGSRASAWAEWIVKEELRREKERESEWLNSDL